MSSPSDLLFLLTLRCKRLFLDTCLSYFVGTGGGTRNEIGSELRQIVDFLRSFFEVNGILVFVEMNNSKVFATKLEKCVF